MGALKVDVLADGKTKTVYHKTGNQGPKWFEGWVQLPVDKEFQTQITATVGNGSLSDLALADLIVQPGSCDQGQLASCSYNGTDHGKCVHTEHKCSDGQQKINLTGPFQVKRYNYVTSFPRQTLEWHLSVDLKIKGVVNGWSNIFAFTSTGRPCCGRGDRLPSVFVHSRTSKLHICTQVGWSGNWNNNDITLKMNQWENLELQQKKETDGKIYFIIKRNGKPVKKVHNSRPMMWDDIKVFFSDDWFTTSNVEVRNFVYRNIENKCHPTCNLKLNDPNFKKILPPGFNISHGYTPTKNKLLGTIDHLTKEWSLSLDVKPLGTRRGWSNVFHATVDNNCCHVGTRIPCLNYYPRSSNLQVCTALNNDVYKCFVFEDVKPFNHSMTIDISQKKLNEQFYQFSVKFGGQELLQKNNIFAHTVREFKNVKMYGSDPWTESANVEVHSLVFRNLVETYPCGEFCKALELVEDIDDGLTATSVTYNYKYCPTKQFTQQLIVPSQHVFIRAQACLEFYYKLGPSKHELHCAIPIYLNDRYLGPIQRPYEEGKWKKYKISIRSEYFDMKRHNVVGVKYSLNDRCENVSFAQMRLLDGVCT